MSTTTAEPSVEELLAQIEAAEKAPEPGTLNVKDVLHRGDDEVPSPIIARAISSAGYTYIWDTATGEKVLTNRNMLPTQLKKVREDGKLRFTTRNPGIPPKVQIVKCLLHPDNPERAVYDAMGLPVCRKANMPSLHQAELHARRRHPSAWAAIKEMREKNEKDEDRRLQREFITSMRLTHEAMIAAASKAAPTKKADVGGDT